MSKNRLAVYNLWAGNKRYVEFMGENLNIGEARLLAKKQDALYLAWADGNYQKLTGHNIYDKVKK